MPVLFINCVMHICSLPIFHLLLCMQVCIQTVPWDLNKRRKMTILVQLMCMQVDSFLQLFFHTELYSLPQKDTWVGLYYVFYQSTFKFTLNWRQQFWIVLEDLTGLKRTAFIQLYANCSGAGVQMQWNLSWFSVTVHDLWEPVVNMLTVIRVIWGYR